MPNEISRLESYPAGGGKFAVTTNGTPGRKLRPELTRTIHLVHFQNYDEQELLASREISRDPKTSFAQERSMSIVYRPEVPPEILPTISAI